MFVSKFIKVRQLVLIPVLIFAVIICSDSFPAFSQKQSGEIKILFIGNSYSFFNDLPGMLEKLAKANEKKVSAKIVARNGASLEENWNEEKAVNAIRGEKWDYVVLQERSSLAGSRTSPTLEYARLFDKEIKKSGAQTLLYLTPAYKTRQADLQNTREGYAKIAVDLNARVVPVGTAFESVFAKMPEIVLHDADDVHPNKKGTFLAAYLFYAAIFGDSPKDLGLEELGIDLKKTEEDIFRRSAGCAN